MPSVALWSFLFSEGCALFLWKIRHFPLHWQTSCNLRSRIFRGTVALVVLSALGSGAVPFLSADTQPADAQAVTKPEDKPAADQSADGLEYLRRAHATVSAHKSIKANLIEQVAIDGRRFKMEGSYLGAGVKLRLELKVQLAHDSAGTLLEVCDGDVLWSRIELPESKRTTRRDVRQILKAISGAQAVPDSVLLAELGLGGIPALLASLERTMDFSGPREESIADRPFTVLNGTWKPDFQKRWPRDKQGRLPVYIPDQVRIFFDRETQFPARLLYLKQSASGKGLTPLVSLEFRDLVLNGPVNEQLFLFVPPDGSAPQDITRQYLDQIQQANAPAATPAPPQKP